MMDEKVKENNQDKERWVLTKIEVLEGKRLYFCICASYLSGMLVCTRERVCTCAHRSTCQYACDYELSKQTKPGDGN